MEKTTRKYDRATMLNSCKRAFLHMIGNLPYDTVSWAEWTREWFDKNFPIDAKPNDEPKTEESIIEFLNTRMALYPENPAPSERAAYDAYLNVLQFINKKSE